MKLTPEQQAEFDALFGGEGWPVPERPTLDMNERDYTELFKHYYGNPAGNKVPESFFGRRDEAV
jgi:hypothetical protein